MRPTQPTGTFQSTNHSQATTQRATNPILNKMFGAFLNKVKKLSLSVDADEEINNFYIFPLNPLIFSA
jgi:hypothetical protein